MPKNLFCKISSQATNSKVRYKKCNSHNKNLPEVKQSICNKITVEINNKTLFSSFESEIENQFVSTSMTPLNEKSVCIPQVQHVTDECTSISSEDKHNKLLKNKRSRANPSNDTKKNKAKNKYSSSLNKDDYKHNSSIEHINNTINDVYQDNEYYNDLLTILKDEKHRFMYRNFSSSYDKEKFYKQIKMRSKKIKNAHFKFNKNDNCNDQQHDNKSKEYRELSDKSISKTIIPIPVLKWAPSVEINITDAKYEQFIQRMKDIWLVDICEMRIEYLLEYLMINNYKTEECFNKIDECMMFVLQKIQNITISQEEQTSSNKYALRKKLKYGY